MKWLDKVKQKDYLLYKRDPDAYYRQMREGFEAFKKKWDALYRLAHHIWDTDFSITKEQEQGKLRDS